MGQLNFTLSYESQLKCHLLLNCPCSWPHGRQSYARPALPRCLACSCCTVHCSNYTSASPAIPELLEGKGHAPPSTPVPFPGANRDPDTVEPFISHGTRRQPSPEKDGTPVWMSFIEPVRVQVPGLSFVPDGTLDSLPLGQSHCLGLSPHPPVQTLRKERRSLRICQEQDARRKIGAEGPAVGSVANAPLGKNVAPHLPSLPTPSPICGPTSRADGLRSCIWGKRSAIHTEPEHLLGNEKRSSSEEVTGRKAFG